MDITQESVSQFGAYGVSLAMAISAVVAIFQIYKQERVRNKEMSDKVLDAFNQNSAINAQNIEAIRGLQNVVEQMDNFLRERK